MAQPSVSHDPPTAPVDLVQYAWVTAAVAEGFDLDEVLHLEGLEPSTWHDAKVSWRTQLAATPEIFEDYQTHLADAEDALGGRVLPLSDDLDAWVTFLRIYQDHPAPFDLLDDHGLGPGDLSRLQRVWAARLDGDPSLAKKASKLAAKVAKRAEAGELPPLFDVAVAPPELRASPAARPTPEDASAAEPQAPQEAADEAAPGLPHELSLYEYAALRADLDRAGDRRDAVLKSHGLATAEQAEQLDRAWRAKLEADPTLRADFRSLQRHFSERAALRVGATAMNLVIATAATDTPAPATGQGGFVTGFHVIGVAQAAAPPTASSASPSFDTTLQGVRLPRKTLPFRAGSAVVPPPEPVIAEKPRGSAGDATGELMPGLVARAALPRGFASGPTERDGSFGETTDISEAIRKLPTTPFAKIEPAPEAEEPPAAAAPAEPEAVPAKPRAERPASTPPRAASPASGETADISGSVRKVPTMPFAKPEPAASEGAPQPASSPPPARPSAPPLPSPAQRPASAPPPKPSGSFDETTDISAALRKLPTMPFAKPDPSAPAPQPAVHDEPDVGGSTTTLPDGFIASKVLPYGQDQQEAEETKSPEADAPETEDTSGAQWKSSTQTFDLSHVLGKVARSTAASSHAPAPEAPEAPSRGPAAAQAQSPKRKAEPERGADEPSAPDGPAEGWQINHYASFCAELAEHPSQAEAIRRRYGLADEAAEQRLHEGWQERFTGDDGLRRRWQQLLKQYRQWIGNRG